MAKVGRKVKTQEQRDAEQQEIKEKLRSSNPDIHLISVPEAAWLLRWDTTTIRRYILAGKIPATMNPRNPQDLAEANGLATNRRSSKVRYRIQKKYIAHLMYGNYIGGELQPMNDDEMAKAITKLNAALVQYEAEQEAQEA